MTTTDTTAKVEWHYWCPAEGDHVFAPNELHVGLCVDALGECIEAHPFVVLPPLPTDEPSQPEALAIVIRDALAAASSKWAEPDGLIDWCRAHGFAFPRPTCGS